MNFPKERLHGFSRKNPARILIHGLRQIAIGKNFAESSPASMNPAKAFEDAIDKLLKVKKSLTKEDSFDQVQKLSQKFLNELKAVSIGAAHQFAHEKLREEGFVDTHINTFTPERISTLPEPVRINLLQLLPKDTYGQLVLIRAKSKEGISMLFI